MQANPIATAKGNTWIDYQLSVNHRCHQCWSVADAGLFHINHFGYISPLCIGCWHACYYWSGLPPSLEYQAIWADLVYRGS